MVSRMSSRLSAATLDSISWLNIFSFLCDVLKQVPPPLTFYYHKIEQCEDCGLDMANRQEATSKITRWRCDCETLICVECWNEIQRDTPWGAYVNCERCLKLVCGRGSKECRLCSECKENEGSSDDENSE